MLFTTFLLATAVGTALALAALLARRNPEVEPLRIPYGPAAVAAAAAALTAVGLLLL
jgi:hypothetical protein